METIREHERRHHCRVIIAEQTLEGLGRMECVPVLGARDLLVDVWNCAAAIGEMVDDTDSSSHLRRLDEGLLHSWDRVRVDMLKMHIIEECSAAINVSGRYRPRTKRRAQSLERIVGMLEHRAGAKAWLA